MRNIFFIKEKLSVRIAYYHIMAFGMALPFDRFFSELVLVSLLIHTLIHLKKTDVAGIFNRRILLLQSLFFVAVICSFYSADKPQAMAELEKQLAILLFPFIFYIHRDVILRYKNRLLFMLAFTATMVITYLYIDALRIIILAHLPLQTLFSAKFLNMNFTEAIDMHPTFLSLYAVVALVYFTKTFFKSEEKKRRIFFFICMIILFAGIIQMSSRSAIIGLLIILNFIIPFLINKKISRLRMIILNVFISLLLVFTIVKTGGLEERMIDGFKSDMSVTMIRSAVTDSRMDRWLVTFDLIKESPVIGYGTGSETSLLKEQYYQHKLYHSFLYELHAHSQFLSCLVQGGIFYLAIYLFVIGYSTRFAMKRKDYLMLSFLVMVVVISVGDNLLTVNKGIFLFSFFSSFFMLFYEHKKLEETVPVGNQKERSYVLTV
jgi:O-antigen ligase